MSHFDHVSSGAFVFTKDANGLYYVLLCKNINNEFWVPKGHLEPGENQIEAAYREIYEETSLSSDEVCFFALHSIIKYEYMEETLQRKKVYLNVFAAHQKSTVKINTNDSDLVSVDWYELNSAREIISFTKPELGDAFTLYRDMIDNADVINIPQNK